MLGGARLLCLYDSRQFAQRLTQICSGAKVVYAPVSLFRKPIENGLEDWIV